MGNSACCVFHVHNLAIANLMQWLEDTMAIKEKQENGNPGIAEAPAGFTEDEQTGLPPYWAPDEEQFRQGIPQNFFGRVIAKDDADPEFVRWIIQAGKEQNCKRGPAENAESILV